MAATSQIFLVSNCPLDNRYMHTIRFENIGAQLAYFNGKMHSQINGSTYLRKKWNIRVKKNYDDLVTANVNYLYFLNEGGKLYFYFIVEKQFVSDDVTQLVLELDILQTYMFNWQLLPCFVEREHCMNTLSNIQMEEGLELGDYVTAGVLDFSGLNNYAIIMLSTLNPTSTTEANTVKAGGNFLNNIFSGLGLYTIEYDHFDDLNNKLQQLDLWGKSDGILAMWMYPKGLIGLQSGYAWGDSNVFKPLGGLETYTVTVPEKGPEPSSWFQGYTPKNYKMNFFPFAMIYVTNNQGQSCVYQPEYWEVDPMTGHYTFGVTGSYGMDSAVKLYPFKYKGENENFEEGLILDNFPQCAWSQDAFKIWYAQNANSLKAESALLHTRLAWNDGANKTMSYIGGAMKVLGAAVGGGLAGAAGGAAIGGVGALPGAIGGALIGGIGAAPGAFSNVMQNNQGHDEIMGGIKQVMARITDAQVQPPHSKGNFSNSTLNVAKGKKTYSVKWKTIDYQHAKAVDDFFTMYGYKINTVKVPDISSRPKFNYVKTIGCSITGVEIEDARKIESIFDTGITFWHDPAAYKDYSVDNGGLTLG